MGGKTPSHLWSLAPHPLLSPHSSVQGGRGLGLRRGKGQRSTTETLGKPLTRGLAGLRPGPRAVVEQGVHLCALQPQALVGVAKQCA